MIEGDYNDRTNNNKYIIVFVVLISALLSFYAGTRFSGFGNVEVENLTRTIGQIEEKLSSQNATINALDNEIEDLNNQLSDHKQLEELYSQLSDEYELLSTEFDETMINFENIQSELNLIKELISGDDLTFTFLVGNMSLTLPQRYIVHSSGLYDSTATIESGIFTASAADDDTLISFSWDTLDSEPDLTKTLDNANSSIGLILEYEMYKELEIGNKNLIYIKYKTILDNEYVYINISTWYDEINKKQYICIVQNTVDNVDDVLQEFVSGFSVIH